MPYLGNLVNSLPVVHIASGLSDVAIWDILVDDMSLAELDMDMQSIPSRLSRHGSK